MVYIGGSFHTVAVMCVHAWTACDVWSVGSKNTVNVNGFLLVFGKHVNTLVFGKS